MKKQQINHLAEFRAKKEMEKKEAEHQTFIENMENKSYKQLSIAQLNYLYEHHKPIYDNLTADREYIIRDLAIIDKLKRRTKQSAEEIEALEEKVGFMFFNTNYRSRWLNTNGSCIVDVEKLQNLQTLPKPELKPTKDAEYLALTTDEDKAIESFFKHWGI